MRERTYCEFCPAMGFCVVCGQGDDGDDMRPGDDDDDVTPIVRRVCQLAFLAVALAGGAALLS